MNVVTVYVNNSTKVLMSHLIFKTFAPYVVKKGENSYSNF